MKFVVLQILSMLLAADAGVDADATNLRRIRKVVAREGSLDGRVHAVYVNKENRSYPLLLRKDLLRL